MSAGDVRSADPSGSSDPCRSDVRPPRLLVSVRSAAEARSAVAGGASIIDIKEPRVGSLGRADVSVWRDVRAAVPDSIPVSVALGELNEWLDLPAAFIADEAWTGIAYRKLGLAFAGPAWAERWRNLRRRMSGPWASQVPWIAVIYADWESARAPDPEEVLDIAAQLDECRGVLIDTWDKGRVTSIDGTWKRTIERIHDSGRLVALAGSLDQAAIERLRPLEPDIFAVRGAACARGDRLAEIESDRVAGLLRAIC